MKLLYTRTSKSNSDTVGRRLHEEAARRGFEVLSVIDLGTEVCGSAGCCRVFIVCNPRRAKGLLQNHMSVATVLPFRIAVYMEDGETKVSTIRPTVLMNIFEVSDLWIVAHQVQRDLEGLIDGAID